MTNPDPQILARGPSETARAKAVDVKRANRRHRAEQLRAVLLDIEVKLSAGALRPEALSHEFIYHQAGVSPATYWRYLKQDEQLRTTADALTGNTARRNDAAGDHDSYLAPPPRREESPLARLEAATVENIRLAAVNINLQRQLAACKTLIGLMDLDLRAKTKESTSKDFLLAAERDQTLKLAATLKELGERCQANGLEIGIELSSFLPKSATRPNPSGSQERIKLHVVDGGQNDHAGD